MSRKLVYLNGQNESLTFETGPYLIVKIEGLGIPNVDRQEQKAPYQDGTTYIDSLLQNRDIVVELAITKPNDFTNIALYRRELSQRLTPKYGLGDLNYTDEDGNEYTIRAVVSSMIFPNKDYRDPYMRAMVTFTACDPYWKSVAAIEIELPTPFLDNAIPITGSAITPVAGFCIRSNGDWCFIYPRTADDFPMFTKSTDKGDTWSTPVAIDSIGYRINTLIEDSQSRLVMAGMTLTGPNVYSSYSSNGTAWSTKVLVGSVSSGISIIQNESDLYMAAYIDGSSVKLKTSSDLITWSSSVTAISTGMTGPIKLYQAADLGYGIVATKSGSYILVEATSSDGATWSAVSSDLTAGGVLLGYVGLGSAGTISAYYTLSGVAYYMTKIGATWNYNGAWFPSATNIEYVFAVISDGGYERVAVYAITGNQPYSILRTLTPVPAVNTGDVPAPFIVTFQGPSVNPRIINQNTLEYIRLNTTLAAADSFEADTSFGNKTVKLIQGGIVKNGIAFLDIGSTFFQLERGSNTVYYEDDAVLSTATASLEFTERYSGL